MNEVALKKTPRTIKRSQKCIQKSTLDSKLKLEFFKPQNYIFLYPSGGKREHVNKVRQPIKVEPKRYLVSKASRASFADIFGS